MIGGGGEIVVSFLVTSSLLCLDFVVSVVVNLAALKCVI